MSIRQELLNGPFAETTQKLALAIAEGQTQLDVNSTKGVEFMVETKITLPDLAAPTKTKEYPLIAMGFFRGYHQFQEAIIEVKSAIQMARSREKSGSFGAKGGFGPFSGSVNASDKSKYNYSQEGSSLLRVKLAPAPPPTIMEYMNKLMEMQGAQIRSDDET